MTRQTLDAASSMRATLVRIAMHPCNEKRRHGLKSDTAPYQRIDQPNQLEIGISQVMMT
jgi:hypothetical protein